MSTTPNPHAQALGRLGRRVNSPAQAEASRKTAALMREKKAQKKLKESACNSERSE